MNDFKPKTLIGSSETSIQTAEKVIANLKSYTDCYSWKDSNIWDTGKSTYENLLRMVLFFDFGVFVATADDLTITQEKLVIEARDNVITEMALFAGALGRDQSFLLVEKGTKLPTDFAGIYNPEFEKGNDKSLENACKKIMTTISEQQPLGHLNLYPTTALAVSYYENYIHGLVESLCQGKSILIDGNEYKYKSFKIIVLLPTDLSESINEKIKYFYTKNNLKEAKIKTEPREQSIWIKINRIASHNITLYNMPSILSCLEDVIEISLGKNYFGEKYMQKIIEQRELNNFKKVLQLMIDKHPSSKKIINIKYDRTTDR